MSAPINGRESGLTRGMEVLSVEPSTSSFTPQPSNPLPDSPRNKAAAEELYQNLLHSRATRLSDSFPFDPKKPFKIDSRTTEERRPGGTSLLFFENYPDEEVRGLSEEELSDCIKKLKREKYECTSSTPSVLIFRGQERKDYVTKEKIVSIRSHDPDKVKEAEGNKKIFSIYSSIFGLKPEESSAKRSSLKTNPVQSPSEWHKTRVQESIAEQKILRERMAAAIREKQQPAQPEEDDVDMKT